MRAGGEGGKERGKGEGKEGEGKVWEGRRQGRHPPS